MQDTVVIKLTVEGESWYVHDGGARINSTTTAKRFSREEAEKIVSHYRSLYGYTVELLESY